MRSHPISSTTSSIIPNLVTRTILQSKKQLILSFAPSHIHNQATKKIRKSFLTSFPGIQLGLSTPKTLQHVHLPQISHSYLEQKLHSLLHSSRQGSAGWQGLMLYSSKKHQQASYSWSILIFGYFCFFHEFTVFLAPPQGKYLVIKRLKQHMTNITNGK